MWNASLVKDPRSRPLEPPKSILICGSKTREGWDGRRVLIIKSSCLGGCGVHKWDWLYTRWIHNTLRGETSQKLRHGRSIYQGRVKRSWNNPSLSAPLSKTSCKELSDGGWMESLTTSWKLECDIRLDDQQHCTPLAEIVLFLIESSVRRFGQWKYLFAVDDADAMA